MRKERISQHSGANTAQQDGNLVEKKIWIHELGSNIAGQSSDVDGSLTVTSLKGRIVYWLLKWFSQQNWLFPDKMRDRFARSAWKRAPRYEIIRQQLKTRAKDVAATIPQDWLIADQANEEELSGLWKADLLNTQSAAATRTRQPLATVIVPTRNRRSRIFGAIDSILGQTWYNFELIIIDDRSTDGTAEAIMSAYNDERIALVPAVGTGVSAARNTGLSLANGEYVAYLDSDNRWLPDFLETMICSIELEGTSLGYAISKVFPNGLEEVEGSLLVGGKFDRDTLLFGNYIDLNTFVHQRTLFKKFGGFDPELERMEDWDFIIRYTRSLPVTFSRFVGVEYDASARVDRVSNSETIGYRDVVRNRYLLDWKTLINAADMRVNDLISIIICVYNNRDLTNKCLTSIFQYEAGEAFEIVIVDNGSDTDTKELLNEWANKKSNIRVVTNVVNLNFASGNNLGAAEALGSTLVFLNNDTVVTPGWLGNLISPLADPNIKGVQPKLLFEDGTIQCVGVVFSKMSPFGYHIYSGAPGDLLQTQNLRRFPAVTAACLAMRASDFLQARGFDPIFVNGQEDIDLCLRIGAGEKVFTCAPKSVVFHLESQTLARRRNISSNRKVFAERWAGRIKAQDLDYYAEDGLPTPRYQPSSKHDLDEGIAIWLPVFPDR